MIFLNLASLLEINESGLSFAAFPRRSLKSARCTANRRAAPLPATMLILDEKRQRARGLWSLGNLIYRDFCILREGHVHDDLAWVKALTLSFRDTVENPMHFMITQGVMRLVRCQCRSDLVGSESLTLRITHSGIKVAVMKEACCSTVIPANHAQDASRGDSLGAIEFE